MNYAKIKFFDVANGIGIGTSLYVQGCPLHCPNCFNSSTWDFDGGTPYTNDTKISIMSSLKNEHVQRLSVLGGEPLAADNPYECMDLVCSVKDEMPDKKVWLYTGFEAYELESMLESGQKAMAIQLLMQNIDYLVLGRFVESDMDKNLKWCGSANQSVIDCNTLKVIEGEVIDLKWLEEIRNPLDEAHRPSPYELEQFWSE
jgi:anaerobic ribonucleoside-triphosphate reductase activating protein